MSSIGTVTISPSPLSLPMAVFFRSNTPPKLSITVGLLLESSARMGLLWQLSKETLSLLDNTSSLEVKQLQFGLSSCCPESQREAALLIGQFANTSSDCKAHIVQRGAVRPLIEMLKSPEVKLKQMSAFALGRRSQVIIVDIIVAYVTPCTSQATNL